MISVLHVAAYIAQRYLREFGETIDEMKLHKLLYFTQRETIIQTGSPMFTDAFQAWRYGPVMVVVREHFTSILTGDVVEIDTIYEPVFDKIFSHYAPKSSVTLSDLSHNELSWRHAREGLSPYDACSKDMLLEDILLDADRIKKRRLFLKRIA